MRRTVRTASEWTLNGVVYRTEAQYLQRLAFDARCDARKVRLMAKIEAERGGYWEDEE